MSDEIKEIINQLEIVARKHTIEVCEDGSKIETIPASVIDELRLNNFSAKVLLDYITNLQQENQTLQENAINNDKVVDKARWNEMIYKSRVEKAIEYMKDFTFEPLLVQEDRKLIMYNENLKNFENILQGDKDE